MQEVLVFWDGECRLQMSQWCPWQVSSLVSSSWCMIHLVCPDHYISIHLCCSQLLAHRFWEWNLCQHWVWGFRDVWSEKCCYLCTSSCCERGSTCKPDWRGMEVRKFILFFLPTPLLGPRITAIHNWNVVIILPVQKYPLWMLSVNVEGFFSDCYIRVSTCICLWFHGRLYFFMYVILVYRFWEQIPKWNWPGNNAKCPCFHVTG